MYADSEVLLERLGHTGIPPRAKVRALRPAAQQVVSIARALSVERAPAGDGRAVGDPRRVRDRDAVRGGAAPHGRGRRRRLHHPSPRRDPPHRGPRDRARGRPHDGDRDPGHHLDRRARGADGGTQGGAAVPRAPDGRRRCAARRARCPPAARRAGGQPPGPRRRGRRPRRAGRLRPHRVAGAHLRHRRGRGGRGRDGGPHAAAPQPGRRDRGRARARARGPEVAGAAARVEHWRRTRRSPTCAASPTRC